jgi:hypothetical protein
LGGLGPNRASFTGLNVILPAMETAARAEPRCSRSAYAANSTLLVEDTYPTLERLENTLEVQALTDARAGKAKAEDFVELRFVNELRKSGFLEKLYGRR